MYAKLKNSWVIIIPCLILIAITTILIFTNIPWSDEGWVAASSANLVNKGILANTICVSQETFKINYPMYLELSQPPVYFLAQALVFKLFGIGLFQIRFLSLFWGIIGLIAIYLLLKKLIKDKLIIFISLILASTNLYYIRASSLARTDIMASSLSLVALAIFINLREKKFTFAVILSNIFICLSGLTHPVGVAGLVALIFLILYLDRSKVNLKIVLLALCPYIVGGISWGIYVIPNINEFIYQFGGHVSGAGFHSGGGNIFKRIIDEFVYRYFLFSYGIMPDNFTIFNILKLLLKISAVSFYFINFFIAAFIIKSKKLKLLWWILLIYISTMAIIISNKAAAYLVWTMPFFAIVVSLVFYKIKKKIFLKITYILFIILVIFVSCSGVFNIIRKNDYKDKYIADLKEFDENYYEGGLIYANTITCFYYGFDNNIIRDDIYLGYYTGVLPDYIAVESRYKGDFVNFENDLKKYISSMLNEKFEKIYKGKLYTFYKKR